MWDLPRPGLEPVSPALAGGFSTTAPPGKPEKSYLHFENFPEAGRLEKELETARMEEKSQARSDYHHPGWWLGLELWWKRWREVGRLEKFKRSNGQTMD